MSKKRRVCAPTLAELGPLAAILANTLTCFSMDVVNIVTDYSREARIIRSFAIGNDKGTSDLLFGVRCMSVNPSDKHLYIRALSAEPRLYVYSATTGTFLRTVVTSNCEYDFAFTEQGNIICLDLHGPEHVVVTFTQSGTELSRFCAADAPDCAQFLAQQNDRVIIGGKDAICVFDTRGLFLFEFVPFVDLFYMCALTPTDQLFVVKERTMFNSSDGWPESNDICMFATDGQLVRRFGSSTRSKYAYLLLQVESDAFGVGMMLSWDPWTILRMLLRSKPFQTFLLS